MTVRGVGKHMSSDTTFRQRKQSYIFVSSFCATENHFTNSSFCYGWRMFLQRQESSQMLIIQLILMESRNDNSSRRVLWQWRDICFTLREYEHEEMNDDSCYFLHGDGFSYFHFLSNSQAFWVSKLLFVLLVLTTATHSAWIDEQSMRPELKNEAGYKLQICHWC